MNYPVDIRHTFGDQERRSETLFPGELPSQRRPMWTPPFSLSSVISTEGEKGGDVQREGLGAYCVLGSGAGRGGLTGLDLVADAGLVELPELRRHSPDL